MLSKAGLVELLVEMHWKDVLTAKKKANVEMDDVEKEFIFVMRERLGLLLGFVDETTTLDAFPTIESNTHSILSSSSSSSSSCETLPNSFVFLLSFLLVNDPFDATRLHASHVVEILSRTQRNHTALGHPSLIGAVLSVLTHSTHTPSSLCLSSSLPTFTQAKHKHTPDITSQLTLNLLIALERITHPHTPASLPSPFSSSSSSSLLSFSSSVDVSLVGLANDLLSMDILPILANHLKTNQYIQY